MGKLKNKDYLFHEDKHISKEMIDKIVQIDPKMPSIAIQSFISPLSDEIGSITCNNFLRSMSDKSNIDSLLGDTSAQVIDALWQEYSTTVMFYTGVNITHFVIIVLYVVYGMGIYHY